MLGQEANGGDRPDDVWPQFFQNALLLAQVRLSGVDAQDRRNALSPPCAPQALTQGRNRSRGADLGYRFDGADVDPEFQGRCANGGRRQNAGLEAFFEVLAKLLGQIAVMREELIRRSGLLGFQSK